MTDQKTTQTKTPEVVLLDTKDNKKTAFILGASSRATGEKDTSFVATQLQSTRKLLNHEGREIPIFILALESQKEVARRQRLMSRLKYHGIEDSVTHIKGFDKVHPDVKLVHGGTGIATEAETGCMLSHLKSIATFLLTSKEEYGLILECDAVPITTIKSDMIEVTKNIPKGTPLIMLNTYITSYHDIQRVSDMFNTIGSQAWSALAYLISRSYAEQIMSKFINKYSLDKDEVKIEWKTYAQYKPEDCIPKNDKKPLTEANKRVSSEIITTRSKGLLAKTQYFIAESFDSTLQTDYCLQHHLNFYKQFDLTKYADADIACEHDEILKYWGLL
ncbi:MAG: hypothetical protein Solumvirus4_24 [Solumvirus sp.]|uniref:Glycosyltransferase family 25 protein n=1 Tax=Solumvirus sp. TaxID=2487773 RepID=A0A3G5AGH5_9VIRU|nr:MAG: hypothetical protein Solumvirus4_24 [Solumvirus sp.]